MSAVDYSTLWQLGYATGITTPDGVDIVVFLDFGPPWFNGTVYGTRLFTTHDYVSTSQIYTATQGFLDGFYSGTSNKPNVYLTLAIGTNNNPNFGGLIQNHGVAWATMINNLNNYINITPNYALKLTARGADDIELSYASASQTLSWVNGYVSAYHSNSYIRSSTLSRGVVHVRTCVGQLISVTAIRK